MRITTLILTAALSQSLLAAAPSSPEKQVSEVLDSFHKSASQAQLEPYFSHFAKDGVFIGTDVTERWTVEEFRAYVAPHFSKGKGWTYIPKDRHIAFNSNSTVAWFDENLENPKYGTARGTGVLNLQNSEWKISQYHLAFPIPNDLAGSFTDIIKSFEAKTKSLPKASR
ncbi:MAG: protein with SnoaL 3 domain, NTF 2 superfamily [Proteobacteria bacterium]|nr:MAG: protein with SnoaL 3 domain, NTF 2 superfamily [Pseudomonadota bacterium]